MSSEQPATTVRCSECDHLWPDSYGSCPDCGADLHNATGFAAIPTPVPLPRAITSGPLSELVPGTMVGEYRVEGLLGAGAMGAVYAAIHPLIGKRAAIKVMSPELCSSAEAIERFVQEARAANAIGHPNIVDVFAFGALPDGRSYFVMEWLPGESLGERIDRGAMSLDDSVMILEEICRAMEAAHDAGITHRDLKPDNIFLSEVRNERPVVKLLDFGIAKLTGSSDTRLQRTSTGVLLGTPLYMSPEQARGEHVDQRADIYSLGALAFEMILGQVPFMASNVMDLIIQHLQEPPPAPRSIWADIPSPLEVLLLRMLAKDPGERPKLSEIRDTLRKYRDTPLARTMSDGARATTAENLPGDRRWLWLIGPVAVVGIAGALLLLRGGETEVRGPGPAASVVAPVPLVTSLAPAVDAQPPAPTEILIKVDGPKARIEIDGELVALAASNARVTLDKPGEHSVFVSAPGRRPYRETVTVEVGSSRTVNVVLRRTPSKRTATKPRSKSKSTSRSRPTKRPTTRSTTKPDRDATRNPFAKRSSQ